MALSASQIASYAAAAGFAGNDLTTAVAVALAESNGNPAAVGDQNLAPSNGPSIGLWQINIGAHPEYANVDLTDPQTNANAAYTIYLDAGSAFSPWSAFNNGNYSQYVSTAQAGVIADAQGGSVVSASVFGLDFTNPVVIAVTLIFGVFVLKDFFD